MKIPIIGPIMQDFFTGCYVIVIFKLKMCTAILKRFHVEWLYLIATQRLYRFCLQGFLVSYMRELTVKKESGGNDKW